MEKRFFEWSEYIRQNGGIPSIVEVMDEVFLLDASKGTVQMTRTLAEIFTPEGAEPVPVMSREDFEGLMSETTRDNFGHELSGVLEGRTRRGSCHAVMHGQTGWLSCVLYLSSAPQRGQVVGFIAVDYDSSREYERHLEKLVQELERAEMINQLILDGSSDYIYQLDLVNNVCTFSANALDVLPLESATFPDAFNRVLSFIIPKDRQLFLDSFTPFLTNKSDRHSAEYRVLTKQGNLMWISCEGKGIHDKDGNPLMIAGSLIDVTERKKHEEEIHRMLYFDLLTGLKNRRSLELDLDERFAQKDARGSLLYIDIRKFKNYNELFGHDFGNHVLQRFAFMLGLFFPGALGIYRFSGDEFVVHLSEADYQSVMAKLVPFLTNLKRACEIDEHTLFISSNVAVVIYPEHGATAEDLLRNANQCLYRMNREGREEVRFFAGETGDSFSRHFHLENEIRRDIENGFRHFRMVYQPLIRLDEDGAHWLGAEALLRYQNPDFEGLDQMELIRTLEYSGLIHPVGRWVIDQAVDECSHWNQQGRRAIVHVNIAAQQVADARLASYISEVCQTHGLPRDCVVAELTETSLVDSLEVATHFCETLIQMGLGVALDDFGTGYSGLNYLKRLPLTEIKVDRNFAHQLHENRYNQSVVSFLCNLSHIMGLKLCVEGVETEDELNLLKKMGVTLIQGFYFSRPLEADVMRREFPHHV